MISSPHNPQLKQIRKLARRAARDRTRQFVAEGEDLIAAADAAGWQALGRYAAAGEGPGGDGWTQVAPALLKAVSTLGSGTRALGVYEQRWGAPAGPLCVYLHGVSDPGNVGTILRSAQAFGASTVVLGPGCADPYGPKAVRASMGAVFAVAVARGVPADLPGERVALVLHQGTPLGDPLPQPLSLLVGAERDGLPEDVLAVCDRRMTIPIQTDSLNAAMAATVALYEVTRVHRMARP